MDLAYVTSIKRADLRHMYYYLRLTRAREELLRLDYNIAPNTQLSYRLTNYKWYIVFPFRLSLG